MNRYALNVAPIDGWQTWFAQGSTSEALSAQAVSVAAKLNSATAAISLSMQGTSSAALLNAATALMTLSIAGDGVIGAQPIIAHPGYGDMELKLSLSAVPASWYAGDGTAQLTLSAKYGLPNPVVIPTTYMAAHRTCVLSVPSENTNMLVPSVEPMLVPPRQTLASVPPMRMP
jgi:hypothetical protein